MKKALILILSLLFVISCTGKDTPKKTFFDVLAEMPVKNLRSYNFDSSSALISRVSDTPGFILGHLKKMDGREDYTSYYPSQDELKKLRSYLELLPPLHQKTLQEKLIGIYFVNNFMGSGMADYVVDENYQMYTILILNPEVLRNDISSWMTYREQTCFINDDKKIKIQFDCGKEYSGLLYTLLHETTHIVDYVHAITPFPEKDIKIIKKGNVERTTPFIESIWENYETPLKKYDKDFLHETAFYGLGGGPKLNISSAPSIYKDLEGLPFASLYGGMNWAEDLAEMVTWYHFTHKLNQPYKIKVYNGSELLVQYEPMKDEKVIGRFNSFIDTIY